MRLIYAVATQKKIKTNRGRQQALPKTGVDYNAIPARQLLIDALLRGQRS